MTTLWYYDQPPDLQLSLKGKVIGVHRDVIRSIPYFQEILDLHPKIEEVVEIPLDPEGVMIFLHKLYARCIEANMTIKQGLMMLKTAHYTGVNEDLDKLYRPCFFGSYTDAERVDILNTLAELTQVKRYQEAFLNATLGIPVFATNATRYHTSIHREDFFTQYGHLLSRDAFQDIARCYPTSPYVLYGLLITRKKECLKILTKMDCRAIFDSRHHLIGAIMKLAEGQTSIFDRYCIPVESLYPSMLTVPIDTFEISYLGYDRILDKVTYQGSPEWRLIVPYMMISSPLDKDKVHISCASYEYRQILRKIHIYLAKVIYDGPGLEWFLEINEMDWNSSRKEDITNQDVLSGTSTIQVHPYYDHRPCTSFMTETFLIKEITSR